jgi:hypothetical protein
MNYWDPTMAALTAIVDVLPKELQDRVIQQLQNMATVCADRGDKPSEFFCRALSGQEFPEPQPKPRPQHLRVVK